MFDDKILTKRINQFLGYGNLKSDYWFIGMEEGGGISLDEINQRLNRWEELDFAPIVDNYEFHRMIKGVFRIRRRKVEKKLSCFFEDKIRYQRTWGPLIRTVLNIKMNCPITTEMVKAYPSSEWGRKNSENCLLELYPLPSPDAQKWRYNEWSNLDSLNSRKTYRTLYKNNRIKLIKSNLASHSPRFVFFYSLNTEYINNWEKISGLSFDKSNKKIIYNKYYAHIEKKNETIFVLTGQPSYIRAHKYWNQLGQYLRKFATE